MDINSHLILICPGIHDPDLTKQFVAGLGQSSNELSSEGVSGDRLLIFPAADQPPYSGLHVARCLCDRLRTEYPTTYLHVPVSIIAFSAGVVGAVAAAWSWRAMGGQIRRLWAIDGWGVPLVGDFPIHRLSHDWFTYESSKLLGAGLDSFYADPTVEHLDIWRSPQTTHGWWVHSDSRQPATRTTAAAFVTALLQHDRI